MNWLARPFERSEIGFLTSSGNTFRIEWGDKSFSYTLAGYSGATYTWTGAQSGSCLINPQNRIQASSFDEMSGLITEPATDVDGGFSLGYADAGDYAVYR